MITTKEWLMRGRRLQERIDAMQEAKRRAYDRAVSTTARPRDVCVVGGSDSSPDDKNASYAILVETVDREIYRLYEIKAEIVKVIAEIDDNIVASAFTKYFVNGARSWDIVANEIHHDPVYVRRDLQSKGIRLVENILQNTTSNSDIMILSKAPKS